MLPNVELTFFLLLILNYFLEIFIKCVLIIFQPLFQLSKIHPLLHYQPEFVSSFKNFIKHNSWTGGLPSSGAWLTILLKKTVSLSNGQMAMTSQLDVGLFAYLPSPGWGFVSLEEVLCCYSHCESLFPD